eukprot:4909892-Pleurochrysis_carterae.AAC.1
MPVCVCGKAFATDSSLRGHLRRLNCSRMDHSTSAAFSTSDSADAAAAAESATRASATKRARSMEYKDRMREK